MGAGPLNTPIRVERRSAVDDDRYGRGNAGAWAAVDGLNPEWARVIAKQGGEESLVARLEKRQPFEILVRKNPATATITAADRIVTLDDLALTIAVTAAAPFQADPSYILITGQAGAASG